MVQVFPVIEKLLNYGVATLCTVALLIGLSWHFWKLKPTLDAQNQLILNNTLATQSLSDTSRATTSLLDKVSDKLIAHDERVLSLQQHMTAFEGGINHIKLNMATMDSTIRMHDRLDKTADKNDMALVHNRLDKIEECVQDMNVQVSKVTGKLGC